MPVVPNTRLIKLALAAVLGAAAVLAGVVAIASPAGAQTGARGALYQHSARTAGDAAALQLTVAGYAYNRNSEPVQEVKAVVYGHRSGGTSHQLYASAPHLADGTHFSAGQAGRLTKVERAYSFAWQSPPFTASADGQPYQHLTVCLWAHDAGSRGGYTKIDKCRPVAHSARSAS